MRPLPACLGFIMAAITVFTVLLGALIGQLQRQQQLTLQGGNPCRPFAHTCPLIGYPEALLPAPPAQTPTFAGLSGLAIAERALEMLEDIRCKRQMDAESDSQPALDDEEALQLLKALLRASLNRDSLDDSHGQRPPPTNY